MDIADYGRNYVNILNKLFSNYFSLYYSNHYDLVSTYIGTQITNTKL